MANSETAVLGGVCFWCLEAVFDRLQGVASVEVVRVTFDPGVLTFRELLDVFFTVHDPTTLNRQGNDAGTQYRSVIFYDSEEQRRVAGQAIDELNAARLWPDPIVTAVEPATKFFVAEDYHQEYFANNGSQPYCQMVVAPKVKKFQQKFAAKMKV